MESIIEKINLFMTINLTTHRLMLIIAFMCSAIIDYMIFTSIFKYEETPNGLALFFAQATIVLGMFVTARIIKKTLFPLWYVSAFFALLGTLATFVTSSGAGLGLASSEIVIANFLLFISFINNKNIPSEGFALVNWAIIEPLGKLVQSVARTCERIAAFWKNLNHANRAALIGIPAAFITLLLLASANPLLEQIIKAIEEILPEFLFAHIFFTVVGTIVALLIFTAGSLTENDTLHRVKRTHSPIAWELVLFFMNIPLVIFTLLQIATYATELSGSTALSLSYSEHATRSVTDAIIATLLCSAVVLVAWAKSENKQKLLLPTGILTGALALLAIVSETRVFEYINELGLTPARITGAVGVAALLVAIIAGGIVLIVQKDTKKPLVMTGALAMIVIGVLPFFQLDRQSVAYNLARATKEQPFDSNLIAELSPEAFPTFMNAIDEGVPMEGMIVECSKNRYFYNSFVNDVEDYVEEEEKRWMNVTVPDMTMKKFLETHDVPAKCPR